MRNEDASAIINGVATIPANATEASGASATINGQATITAVVGEVHFAQAQIDGQCTVAASARYLWEPKAKATTIWIKQVA